MFWLYICQLIQRKPATFTPAAPGAGANHQHLQAPGIQVSGQDHGQESSSLHIQPSGSASAGLQAMTSGRWAPPCTTQHPSRLF